MSKFCTKCGTELPSEAIFCKGCGAKCDDNDQKDKVVEVTAETNKEKKVEQSESDNISLKKDNLTISVNPTVLIIVGMVLLTIIIIVMILVFGINSKKVNDSDKKDISETSTVELIDEYDLMENNNKNVEDVPYSDTSSDGPYQDAEETQQTVSNEEIEIIDYNTAFEKFVADPYLNHIPFPGYGDFVSIESKELFGMAVLINVNEEYVRSYAKEETPRNGYTKNIFESSENGLYQYLADNGKGQTCQVIFNDGKMMILVGDASAFNR